MRLPETFSNFDVLMNIGFFNHFFSTISNYKLYSILTHSSRKVNPKNSDSILLENQNIDLPKFSQWYK